jgi:hypothetical protein
MSSGLQRQPAAQNNKAAGALAAIRSRVAALALEPWNNGVV